MRFSGVMLGSSRDMSIRRVSPGHQPPAVCAGRYSDLAFLPKRPCSLVLRKERQYRNNRPGGSHQCNKDAHGTHTGRRSSISILAGSPFISRQTSIIIFALIPCPAVVFLLTGHKHAQGRYGASQNHGIPQVFRCLPITLFPLGGQWSKKSVYALRQ